MTEMNEIEKLWQAKRRIEEVTAGKQHLIIGFGGYLTVQVDQGCLAAIYLAMIKNRQSGMYHCDVKGYVRRKRGIRPESIVQGTEDSGEGFRGTGSVLTCLNTPNL